MNSRQIGDFIDSPTGKITGSAIGWLFRALIVAVVTLAGYNFREFSTKLDHTVSQAELTKAVTDANVALTEAKNEKAQSETRLWSAINSVTKSVSDLTTSVSVMTTRVDLTNQNLQSQVNDLKQRVNHDSNGSTVR